MIARQKIMRSVRDCIGTLSTITSSEEKKRKDVIILFWYNVAVLEYQCLGRNSVLFTTIKHIMDDLL